MSDWNDEEYEYQDAPKSHLSSMLDDESEMGRMMDWAEATGLRNLITTREGANFVQRGDLWVIPLMGGQPIHHDRHILHEEKGTSHTWNIVCSGDGSQMLVTEVAQDMFNHMPIKRGALIYLNTLNRHLVTRNEGTEVCVLLQRNFDEKVSPQEAVETILQDWRKLTA